MEKKETPVKQRKLKKIDEYLEKIPLAWRFCQRAVETGIEPRKAELQAVKRVYPGDKNSSTTLRIWKEYGLWPPSEELLSGRIVGDDESSFQRTNGFKIIRGGAGKVRRLIAPEELSEKEILQQVRKILDKIEVHHKEWTGGRLKKFSVIKTKILAGRLPVDLLNEIHKFKGSKTYHLERALRLYVKVMRETV